MSLNIFMPQLLPHPVNNSYRSCLWLLYFFPMNISIFPLFFYTSLPFKTQHMLIIYLYLLQRFLSFLSVFLLNTKEIIKRNFFFLTKSSKETLSLLSYLSYYLTKISFILLFLIDYWLKMSTLDGEQILILS